MKKTITVLWITSVLLSSCWLTSENNELNNPDNTMKTEVTPPSDITPKTSWNQTQSQISVDETQTFEKVTELKKEILIEWKWEVSKAWDIVSVHYYWRFIDWSKFDSSLDRWDPFWFTLWAWMVIKWWDEWVTWMTIWEVARFHIPSTLWYWENTYWPIPWWSTLIFDVELLWINK